jgi:hypothetical protein
LLKSVIIIFTTLALAAPAHSAGPGTSAATFLQLGFGARPLGLGEAYVAMADDVAALYYNPAGLAYSNRSQFSRQESKQYEMLVSHSLHIQDIKMSQLGLLKRPWGLAVTHLGIGGIERRTSETVSADGTFGAQDMSMAVSYAHRMNGIGMGGTMKIIRQTIGEFSATAYAVDAGVLYRMRGKPISLGASLTNLGTEVKFIDRGFPLPMTMRFGATFGMTRKFPHALSVQVDVPRDNDIALRLGLEYLGFGPFALRAGYRTTSGAQRTAALGRSLGSQAGSISEFYGMFMGTGFRSKFGNMDYALLPFGELGNTHRFSFTLKFGNSLKTGRVGVFQ